MDQSAVDVRFSIVIPFLKGKRGFTALLGCVESCLKQCLAPQLEILVVSNLPEPYLAGAISKFGPAAAAVKLECVGEIGVNRARNLGARKARGDFIFFLDDDCELPRQDFLADIERMFARFPDFSAFGGPYVSSAGASWRVRGYNAMTQAWISLHARPHGGGEVQFADHLLGGNACYRRGLFDRGLFFDENIVSGGDEWEYQRRLRRKGHALGYSAELKVIHHADPSWQSLFSRARNHRRARSDWAMPRAPLLSALGAFWREVKGEPSLFLFSIFHFSSVFWPKAHGSPQLTHGIEDVCRE